MNFKRKSGYKKTRSCGFCKPWKRQGNSMKLAAKHQLIEAEIVKEDGKDY